MKSFLLPRINRNHDFSTPPKKRFTGSQRRSRLYALFFTFSLTIAALTASAGCTFPANAKNAVSSPIESAATFDSFLDEFFRSEVTGNTINLHFTLSDPESYGITESPITLGNISQEAISDSFAKTENILSLLEKYDYEDLSVKQQLTYDILSDYLHTQLRTADLSLYEEILKPSTGIQAQLPVLYEEYKFYTKDDVGNYLALIALTGDYFEQIIDFEQKKADAGLFMSDFTCDNIISQCENFIANTEDHYLIVTFNNKVEQLADLSAEEREAYKSKNETLVKENVLPTAHWQLH